jgi:hypothetical protein
MAMATLKRDFAGQDLTRKKFFNQDFSEQDLSKLRMKQSTFHRCNFDRADMSETDCEGSEFLGSSFKDTNCYRTNFKDAKLAGTIFKPHDCFGMTLTLQCSTFKDLRISALWWYVWLMFAGLMKPGDSVVEEEKLQTDLVTMIGPERYVKLRATLTKREL